MRLLVLCVLSVAMLGLTGCGPKIPPKELQAPPGVDATPDNSGDRPQGYAAPESPE